MCDKTRNECVIKPEMYVSKTRNVCVIKPETYVW